MAEASRTAAKAAIKRATLDAHKAVEKLDTQSLDELAKLYKQAAADIAVRINAHAGADGNVALQEMRNALAQIEARLRELSQARDGLLNGAMANAADLGTRPFTAAAGAGETAVTTSASMRVANEALQFVRTFVASDGLQLSDRIWRIDRHARDTVVNAIEQAVIQGHGATQAARELLARGLPVPGDITGKMNAANASSMGKTIANGLMNDVGSPMDNAMRLMRTEINRAHGEAYMMSGQDHPDFGGWRYLLSPAHPKPDICDLLSNQNVHGLGPGVYPTREQTPWPAHPNTLSFIEIVFKDEITQADRDAKETPLQALDRLSAAKRIGVLGKHKAQAFNDGKLKTGMVRAPWKTVRKRIGDVKFAQKFTPPAAPDIAHAQSVGDALAWLQRNAAKTVRLSGADVKTLRSIGDGIDAVMVPQGVRVGELGWIQGGHQSVNAHYAHRTYGHLPGENDLLEFRKSYATNAAAAAEKSRQAFHLRRSMEIDRLRTLLEEPNRTAASRRALETQLALVQAAKRWSASSVAEDPLFVTAAHEAGHAVSFSRPAVRATWSAELDRLHVTKLEQVQVSKYATTKHDELFAEVTALIADGKRSEVPERILQAYDAALRQVK